MSTRPYLSVVLPSNKNSEQICKTLFTLVDPTLDDVEYLIDLDGVDDHIHDRIRSMGIKNLFISNYSGKISHVLNQLIANARGVFIARADDDDLYAPSRLRMQAEYLESRTDIHVVGSAIYLAQDGAIIGKKMYPSSHDEICIAGLFANNIFAHPVVMGRAEFFKENPYKDAPSEDFELWARGIQRGYRYANLEVPLMTYNLGSHSPEAMHGRILATAKTVLWMLNHIFLVEPDMALKLTSILSTHVHCDIGQQEQRECLGWFAERLGQLGYGNRILRDVTQRYQPALLALMN